MPNSTRENSQPGSSQSITGFDYGHFQPMGGLVYTALHLPPVIESDASASPSPAVNPSHVPAPVSAPLNRPVQDSWPQEDILRLFNLKQSGIAWEEIHSHFPGQDHGEIQRQYEAYSLEKRRAERRARDEVLYAELRRAGFDKCTLTDY